MADPKGTGLSQAAPCQLGIRTGIPVIPAISLHTPSLSHASCTLSPLQDPPAQLTPSKLAGKGPTVAHSDLSACMQTPFTLKPTDSSSEHHHRVLCSGFGALGIGGFLPLLSREARVLIPTVCCCASSSLPRPPPKTPLCPPQTPANSLNPATLQGHKRCQDTLSPSIPTARGRGQSCPQ